jgi:hypothetical protein
MRSIASHDANGSVSSSGTGFVPSKGRDARQASGALDAGEKSADEDSVDADVHKFSEHLWGVCGGRAEGKEMRVAGRGRKECLCHVMRRVEHSWTDRTHTCLQILHYTAIVNQLVYKCECRMGSNVCSVCTVASFSSFITLENALKFGPDESTVKYAVNNGESQRKKGVIPCSWNNTLSLVVICAPAWRIRSSAQGTSSLLQLETPSASTCTSYPCSRKSRVDWSTHT